MATWRVALTTCRVLLIALLLSMSYSAAQDTSPQLTKLYNFTGGNSGNYPDAAVVIGSGGVLYGTTYGGGTSNLGTVFSLTPPATPGGTWTETVLHSFLGPAKDGSNPYASVVIGKGGVLYGTTVYGGTSGFGTVFSLTPPASSGGAWTETVLHNFAGGSDGTYPSGAVIVKGGVLFGTTYEGGTSNQGTVFSLTPPASPGGAWTENVIHSFLGAPNDGGNPYAALLASGEVLYGTTYYGGTGGCGTVFSLTPPASPGGAWTEAVLYSFTGGGDGSYLNAPVVIGSGGVLYGATVIDGTGSCPGSEGCGAVFSLTPPASPGGSWTVEVLHLFLGSPGDGGNPYATVVIGSGGVLYGTTYHGGTDGGGTIFSLTPPASAGGAWTETILHNFTGGDGKAPSAALVIGKNGALYGTTYSGGKSGYGTVFRLTP